MILLALLVAAAPFEIAITVDDLPVHGPETPGMDRMQIEARLLAAFRKHRLPPVTGFVNGSKIDQAPLVRGLWQAFGNPIGNHGFRHLSLTDTSVADYVADIEANESFITTKIFRYPFLFEGETLEKRDAVRGWLFQHGYRIAQVTVDGDDWVWNPPYARCTEKRDWITLGRLRRTFLDAQVRYLAHYRALAQQLLGREPRHIYLLHVGAMDADQMDALLSSLEAAGARFITLERALEDPLYQTDPKFATKDGSTLLDKMSAAQKLPYPKFDWPDEKWLENACR
jgi:peptidoglycan/xylan/chitin deacetylase (PgdA/CDA1 family)